MYNLKQRERKNEEDKKVRILWQGVHCQQRSAEVLLRQLCRRSKEGEEEKKRGFPQGGRACYRTETAGVPHLLQGGYPHGMLSPVYLQARESRQAESLTHQQPHGYHPPCRHRDHAGGQPL